MCRSDTLGRLIERKITSTGGRLYILPVLQGVIIALPTLVTRLDSVLEELEGTREN